MIVYYMGVKYGHGYTGATHMTKVFVKGTILFLQCIYISERHCMTHTLYSLGVLDVAHLHLCSQIGL